MAVLNERRNKGRLEMARERQRLSQVKLLAPDERTCRDPPEPPGHVHPGMQIPDIREGDQVQPGIPVADVLDLSELEVIAKIGELDRANLKEGQDVNIRLDAVGDKTFHGKIKSMSGTASANIFSGDPAKKFDVVFSLDMKELLTGLGAKPEQIRKVLADGRSQPQEAARRRPLACRWRRWPPGMMMARAVAVARGGGARRWRHGGGAPAAAGGGGAPMAGAPAGGQGPRADRAPQADRCRSGGRGGLGAEGGGRAVVRRPGRRHDEPAVRRRRQEIPRSDAESSRREEHAGSGAGRAGQGDAGSGEGRPCRGEADAARRPGWRRSGRMRRQMGGGAGQFSRRRISTNAKLPPPSKPSRNSMCCCGPGLLADVEIILEKIPERDQHSRTRLSSRRTASRSFTSASDKGWEERVIKPMKRSESVMVIASGVKPGEVIAMSDPFAKPGDKKKDKPAVGKPGRRYAGWRSFMSQFSGIGSELKMGLSSLFVHKLRSLLTMLGMIFGVGAVVAMLVDHRRRAEGDDELHRSPRREQHHHRSARKRWTATSCRRAARSRPD